MAAQRATDLVFGLGLHAGERLRGNEVFLVLRMMLAEGLVRNDDFLVGSIVAQEDALTLLEDTDNGVKLPADLYLFVEGVVSGEQRVCEIVAEHGYVGT